ncbi:MAG: hypothetical protein AB8G22_24345, partial [Saprospiraceae bacterium]
MKLNQSLSAYVFSLLFCCFTLGMNAQTFVNPLPIPPLLNPQVDGEDAGAKDTIRLRIDEVKHNFNPNGDMLNQPIISFAYNHADSTHLPNTILGPTIRWRFG